jgi:hypothetical protein
MYIFQIYFDDNLFKITQMSLTVNGTINKEKEASRPFETKICIFKIETIGTYRN